MLTAKSEFDRRFFLWARQDWAREIEQNFPLLRSVNENLILKIMEDLEDTERWALAKALVKRGRSEELLNSCGDPLTDRDKEYERFYVDMVTKSISGEAYWDEERSRKAKEAFFAPRDKRLNRRKFRKYIIQALIPILGEDYEDWGDWKEWRYCTPIGPWKVITYVDVGGSAHQLCYEHDIIASERVYLFQNISLLRWLGISSQIQWQCLQDSDAKPTAEALTKIVAHFMNVVPKLLEGLTPD